MPAVQSQHIIITKIETDLARVWQSVSNMGVLHGMLVCLMLEVVHAAQRLLIGANESW